MTLACTSLAVETMGDALQQNAMAEDISGNGYHGAYAVAGFTSVQGATTDGLDDRGVHLDGVANQFIIVPDTANLQIDTLLGILSWEFWIRSASFATQGATTQRVWAKNEDAGNQWAINLTDSGDSGRLGIGVDYASVQYSVTANDDSANIPLNAWTHCVVTMNATTPLLYVNGVLAATTASSQGIGSGLNMLFGRMVQDSTTGLFTGDLDEAALYPDVLTPLEILTHYAASDRQNANLLVRSQELDNASWTKTRSNTTANATTAPNASVTAEKLYDDATASATHYIFQNNVPSTVASEIYTFSVYAKAGERDDLRLLLQGGDAVDGIRADFDLTAITATERSNIGNGIYHTSTITDVGNGWRRCAITGIYSTTPSVTTVDPICFLMSAPNTITYNGDGASGLYLWGAHLRLGGLTKYLPTTTAAVALTDYPTTILADAPNGYWPLGEGTLQQLNSWPQKPIMVAIANRSVRESVLVNTIQIDDTLGEQTTCTFTLVNPESVPVVGDTVRVTYFSEVLFAGTVNRVTEAINNTMTAHTYACECVDWLQVLLRRKFSRTMTDNSVSAIVASVLANELGGEGFSTGTIDLQYVVMPIVDTTNGRVFDILRDVAGATGQTFWIDADKRIQMRSVTNPVAPVALTVETVETATVKTDRETYRNTQTVIVTGTPAAGVEPNSFTQTRTNPEQIAQRLALEGGTGIYEEIEEVTHPTSNDVTELALLGIGYSVLRLATSGAVRQTVNSRVRHYGFRAGQIATLTLNRIGVVGTYIIQRVSITEQDGRRLVHELELTASSSQQRAYESWLAIVRQGKVVVQIPSATTTNLQTFSTPGNTTWTVPAGVTAAEFTSIGGGGGGGAGDKNRNYTYIYGGGSYCEQPIYHRGGTGGTSGLAVSVESVVEGQIWEVTVGSGGALGTNGTSGSALCHALVAPVSGTDGASSLVHRFGITSCLGNGGKKGTNASSAGNGVTGAQGGGTGQAVTVGGGVMGGGGGYSTTPAAGTNGRVEVRW
jgi:hypothetical protein